MCKREEGVCVRGKKVCVYIRGKKEENIQSLYYLTQKNKNDNRGTYDKTLEDIICEAGAASMTFCHVLVLSGITKPK